MTTPSFSGARGDVPQDRPGPRAPAGAAQRIGVLQLVSGLCLGGAERVAVNLANTLPRDRFVSHLCATRERGPLEAEIADDVGTLWLSRKRRWDDLPAALELARYVRRHRIAIIHAHTITVFLGSLARLLGAPAALLWHDHYGHSAGKPRSPRVFRVGTRLAAGIISVNKSLQDWAITELKHPPERVWYVPNFVVDPKPLAGPLALPGAPGRRIVCVARVDAQKDLLNLVRAMEKVVAEVPDAHALVLGVETDPAYGRQVREEIASRGLADSVSLLGPRTDATDVVQACDIAVLSSASEGLPLALIEYGLCRRPSVVTDVGQCADVLDGGRAGIVVPPHDPARLAQGLVRLLRSPEERQRLAELAWRHARLQHSAEAVLEQVAGIYATLLDASRAGGRALQPAP